MATKKETVEIKIEVQGEKQASKALKNISGSTESMTDSFIKGGIAVAAIKGSIRLATDVIKKSITETIKFANESLDAYQANEQAMTSLKILAPRFGVAFEEAQDSAKKMGEELRIGTTPAAEALQTLLSDGIGLEQAEDLMRRFANEAIIGKNKSIDMSDAVLNLALAFKRKNSVLGDASGITENWSDIIDNGRESLIDKGIAVKDITEDMAKYEGIIVLTDNTLGAFAELSDSTRAKQEALRQKFVTIKETVGNLLDTALGDLLDYFKDTGAIEQFEATIGDVVTKLTDWWQLNKGAVFESIDAVIEKVKEWYKENREGLIASLEELWEKIQNIDWEQLLVDLAEAALAVGQMAIDLGILITKVALFLGQHTWILAMLATLKGFSVVAGIFNDIKTAIGVSKAVGASGAVTTFGTTLSTLATGPIIIAGAAVVGLMKIYDLLVESLDAASISAETWATTMEQAVGKAKGGVETLESQVGPMKQSFSDATTEMLLMRDGMDEAGTKSGRLADKLGGASYQAQQVRDSIAGAVTQLGRYVSASNFIDTGSISIPRFASGGVAPGGMAMVGERGPELVNLPKGSRVFSNGQSERMLNQTNNNNKNVNIGNVSFGGGDRGLGQSGDLLSQLLLGQL